MDPQELVVAYQASNPMEAQFIVNQLAAQGIRAVCDGLDMQNQLGPWDGNPRVYVQAGELDRARPWLDEYEQRQVERGEHPWAQADPTAFEWKPEDLDAAEQPEAPES